MFYTADLYYVTPHRAQIIALKFKSLETVLNNLLQSAAGDIKATRIHAKTIITLQLKKRLKIISAIAINCKM